MSQQREAPSGHGAPTAHGTLLTGSRHGTVTALDAATGAILWLWAPGPRLGTVAHGGEIVYIPTDSPQQAVRYLDGPPPRTPEEHRNRKIAVGHPMTLAALRASDGAVLWQKEGWRSTRSTHLMLDGDLLIADAPSEELGQVLISAYDAQSGETRWTYDTGSPWGITERLIAARAGRVFVHEGGFAIHRLHVLDARTGAVLWSREQVEHGIRLSEGGRLLIVYVVGANGTQEHVVLNADDGATITALPHGASVLAFTDGGIAYVAMGFDPWPALSAIRISDGAELWRASGIEARHLVVTNDVLYYARLTRPGQLAEVGALDALTGQRLWQWHSPAHLIPLLRLWGGRTPIVIVHAVNEGRRARARARQYHERGVIRREILHGQWRRAGALSSNFQVTAGLGMVYVATSLGLFALHARDGHLLWHALPTFDLGWTVPVVSPERRDT